MIVLAGVAGSAAVLSRTGATFVDIVPTLIGAACGIATLRLPDVGPVRRRPGCAVGLRRATESRISQPIPAVGCRWRRWVSLAVGVLAGVLGAVLSRQLHSVSGDREAFKPPPVKDPIPPVPPTVQPAGVALPSFVTSGADFYRIDTALSVPQLSRADWQLKIHGMVDREITYRFDDLAKFDLIEKMVTLACVSNPVGGDLISNAVWTGYRVRDLLAAAGVHSDADMVLSTSSDGFTAGTPVEALTDDRDSLLAITLDGQPLPVEHGYPARLVVPGLYGYVSATKWIVDLEVTRSTAPSRTGRGSAGRPAARSRRSHASTCRAAARTSPRGPVRFGGVAWAQHRGVKAVEVRIDDGPWQPAQLGAALQRRHLAAVELRLAGRTDRKPSDRGAGDGQHRSGADVG